MRLDYHVHTHHSMDGKQTLEQLCEAAVRQGIEELCLTEHYEPHHPHPGADIPPRREAVLANLERARAEYPELSLRLGLEIGDFPLWHNEIVAWLKEWPLDYRLLSLHLVDGLDPYAPEYFERYDFCRETAYTAYVRAVLDSLRSWTPEDYDCLAHLGYVSKRAPYPKERRPLFHSDAPEMIDEILRLLAHTGKSLEINTSGYSLCGQPIPGPDILQRFRDVGGEFVMFGSDAHRPEDVGRYLDEARALAQSCGLRYTLRFRERKAQPILLV